MLQDVRRMSIYDEILVLKTIGFIGNLGGNVSSEYHKMILNDLEMQNNNFEVISDRYTTDFG